MWKIRQSDPFIIFSTTLIFNDFFFNLFFVEQGENREIETLIIMIENLKKGIRARYIEFLWLLWFDNEWEINLWLFLFLSWMGFWKILIFQSHIKRMIYKSTDNKFSQNIDPKTRKKRKIPIQNCSSFHEFFMIKITQDFLWYFFCQEHFSHSLFSWNFFFNNSNKKKKIAFAVIKKRKSRSSKGPKTST